MAIVVRTNPASIFSQHRLGRTSNQLGKTFQRLASGSRINSAADDAADGALAARTSGDDAQPSDGNGPVARCARARAAGAARAIADARQAGSFLIASFFYGGGCGGCFFCPLPCFVMAPTRAQRHTSILTCSVSNSNIALCPTPLLCTLPTRVFTLENTAGSTSVLCMRNR